MKAVPPSIDEFVTIPEKDFKFPSDLAIFDDMVAYMSPKDGGVGVLIESKEMAEVMKQIFDLAFLGAKNTEGSRYVPPRKS